MYIFYIYLYYIVIRIHLSGKRVTLLNRFTLYSGPAQLIKLEKKNVIYMYSIYYTLVYYLLEKHAKTVYRYL